MRYIGIDLGTSNSLIAEVVINNNEPVVTCLKNNLGKYSFPSVLSYVDRQKCYFGDAAEERLFTNPKSTVSIAKTRLGLTTQIPVFINNKLENISPQEVMGTLLKQLTVRYADNINRAVITKPANYGINQNQAMKDIVDITNFELVDTIEEPSAAVMYHIFNLYKNNKLTLNEFDKSKNILVFDFGGGTLDLSLVSVTNINNSLSTKVLCNEGNTSLGGELLDLIFEKFVLDRISQLQNNLNVDKIKEEFEVYYNNFINGCSLTFSKSATENEIKFIYNLKKILERVKIELSSKESSIIDIPDIGKFPISRSDFESFVLQEYGNEIGLKDKIRDLLIKISNFSFKKNLKIYQIVFVGGTSNIPFIRSLVLEELKSMIEDYNEESIFISDDYATAIVKGAAILCAIKDGVEIKPFNSKVCRTIISKKIELDYHGNKSVVVNEGEEYPFEKDKVMKIKIFNSLATHQTIVFNEIEEFSDGTEQSKKVLDFNFHLPIYYTGDDLSLYFNVDKNGLYKMKLVHKFTDDEIDFEHNIIGSLNEIEKKEVKKVLSRF